jgi:hypothetical protein
MSDRTPNLDELLPVDPEDPGCEATLEVFDLYVEADLSGVDPATRFPGAAAHLRGCPAAWTTTACGRRSMPFPRTALAETEILPPGAALPVACCASRPASRPQLDDHRPLGADTHRDELDLSDSQVRAVLDAGRRCPRVAPLTAAARGLDHALKHEHVLDRARMQCAGMRVPHLRRDR